MWVMMFALATAAFGLALGALALRYVWHHATQIMFGSLVAMAVAGTFCTAGGLSLPSAAALLQNVRATLALPLH